MFCCELQLILEGLPHTIYLSVLTISNFKQLLFEQLTISDFTTNELRNYKIHHLVLFQWFCQTLIYIFNLHFLTSKCVCLHITNKECFHNYGEMLSLVRRVRVNCSKSICSNLDFSTLFFRNLDCSTEKCHLLDRKKYAVRVPRVNFEQLIKKCNCSTVSSSWHTIFCDSKI